MILKIFEIFNSESILQKAEENDVLFTYSVKYKQVTLPNKAQLDAALAHIHDRDTFSLSFTILSEACTLTRNGFTDKFLDEIRSVLEVADTSDVECELNIEKAKVEDTITIYSFETFTRSLVKLKIAETLSILSRALGASGKVQFETVDSTQTISTACISIGNQKSIDIKEIKDQDNLIANLKSNTFFSDFSKFKLSPECFYLTNTKHGTEIEMLFEKLLVIFSVIYLFDQTSINDDELQFKLKGYKSIDGRLDIKSYKPNNPTEYFRIFKWVYTGGNISDKIGLARNIISLHFDRPGELQLKGDTMGSIRSSYLVYERQNIKQYIEIRNKVSDQLTEFNERANKVIEGFASGFQKSIFGLITFYTSSIIIKVFASGKFTDVFTLDVSIVSTSLLAISLVYCKVARWEVKAQKERLIKSYENLKRRYSDLLDQNDIRRLLGDDQEFSYHKQFIDDKLKTYTQLWVSTLSILFLITTFLYTVYHSPIFGH